MISNQCFTVFFPSSLMTVPFSCPIMEATWTWSRPWQSREMNWRVFRKREGKITIASVSVPVVSFPTLSPNNGMYTMCWNEKHSKSLHTLVVYVCCTSKDSDWTHKHHLTGWCCMLLARLWFSRNSLFVLLSSNELLWTRNKNVLLNWLESFW